MVQALYRQYLLHHLAVLRFETKSRVTVIPSAPINSKLVGRTDLVVNSRCEDATATVDDKSHGIGPGCATVGRRLVMDPGFGGSPLFPSLPLQTTANSSLAHLINRLLTSVDSKAVGYAALAALGSEYGIQVLLKV